MALQVKLEVFEGPLDLLLHLIDKNKVDIYDIPIVEITEQYLDYIRQMETEDMNVMSEFLVMAATLLDIKCRMLLPKQPHLHDPGRNKDTSFRFSKIRSPRKARSSSFDFLISTFKNNVGLNKNGLEVPDSANIKFPINFFLSCTENS